jgi:hypothetical protein
VKPDMSFHEIVVDDGGFRVHDHNSWDDISWQFPMVGIFSEAILIISTLWLFNIAMENGWKWPIYRWFSQLNTSIYKGFSMAMFTRWYILDHISPWLSHHKYYNYIYIYIHNIYPISIYPPWLSHHNYIYIHQSSTSRATQKGCRSTLSLEMSQESQNLGARPPLPILSACVDGFPVEPWWCFTAPKKALWVTGWNPNPWNNMEQYYPGWMIPCFLDQSFREKRGGIRTLNSWRPRPEIWVDCCQWFWRFFQYETAMTQSDRFLKHAKSACLGFKIQL